MLEAIRRVMNGTAPRVPQRPEDGTQYFMMHPRLRRLVERRLVDGDYAPLLGSATPR
jgi:hypothetical protein